MRIHRIVEIALAAFIALAAGQVAAAGDSNGPNELVYKVRMADLAPAERKDLLARTIEVVRRRVDADGRLHLEVAPRGEEGFSVKFPTNAAPGEKAHVETLLRTPGQLVFSLVDERGEDMDAARRGEGVPNTTPFLPLRDPATQQIVRDERGRIKRWRKATFQQVKNLPADISNREWYLVENKAYVTGSYLSEVKATTDRATGQPQIAFSLRGNGRAEFERLTDQCKPAAGHPGRLLAILFDQDLLSAPEIRSQISGTCVIPGSFTQKEVDDMVTVLRSGMLPVDIELVSD